MALQYLNFILHELDLYGNDITYISWDTYRIREIFSSGVALNLLCRCRDYCSVVLTRNAIGLK